MTDRVVRRMWNRVATWFAGQAQQVTVEFLPEPGRVPIPAYQGYLRLWLGEGFLARSRAWGNQHYPALHGGLALRFLGTETTPFTTFARPPDTWSTPGAQLDFPVTALLPFNGGSVEVEAALYQVSVAGPLATAVDLVGSLASLMGPPLSTAATIADKVSDGLDAVLAATGAQPVLGVHWAMVAPGGGGNVLGPGHLVVVNAPRQQLAGTLAMVKGRLHHDTGNGPRPLAGVDYLVVRLECRTERDDWRFPDLDELVRQAGTAYLEGQPETFKARRTEAIARAWASTDLIPIDRKRVAWLVAGEIDGVKELGAVPGPARTLEMIAPQRLPTADAPELAELRLDDLLTS
jgi:hypothetical protein